MKLGKEVVPQLAGCELFFHPAVEGVDHVFGKQLLGWDVVVLMNRRDADLEVVVFADLDDDEVLLR